VSDLTLRPLTPSDGPACDAIILSLPYHFGNAGGRAECARAVREDSGLVAERSGQIVGFLVCARRYERSAEITWLAVDNAARGNGVGTALVERLEEQLRAEGRTLLLVMTLSDSADESGVTDSYVQTRAFYRKLGFEFACEFLDLWPGNPALLLVKSLALA
jgi:ribosomal protein S18 acetylase RimI-like enzyme